MASVYALLKRNGYIALYGLGFALLLALLKWLEWRFILISHALEIYVGLVALLFTLLGVWVALKLARPKVEVRTVVVEKEVEVYIQPGRPFTFNETEANNRGLSTRELEVLQLMAEGLSNREIAGRLFVSLNTVKTHSSNLFEKMDVKRRTQAVEKAKRLSIIP